MYRPDRDPSLDGLRTLGQGGTALVYEARHTGWRRRVAIKCPLPDAATQDSPLDFTRIANREFQLIGGRRFPGLVRILADPSPAYDHLFLQLCEGPSLEQVLPITDLPTALNVISALALDLEYLRASGIAHGDLKPQNFFLPSDWRTTAPSRLFYAKLSDFSLGRLSSEPEDARLGVGTVGYMAPETVKETPITHQSDLFALGVIAYQILAGAHPFIEDDIEPVRINSRVCEDDPTPLRELRADLPSGVIEIVERLLAKKTDDRADSGWSVCLALEQTGATYPFRQALRPGHHVADGVAYDDAVTAALKLDEADRTELDELTDRQVAALRVVLGANFRRDSLKYQDGRFELTGRWYRPTICRRRVLHQYSNLPLAEKRRAVRAAVAGGYHVLDSITEPKSETPASSPRLLPRMLLPLLHITTVKRTAARLATTAEHSESYTPAAELYVMAGQLETAERCADVAARELRNKGQNRAALNLLRKVLWFASDSGKEFECRRAFVLNGAIHLENGEIEAAKASYQRVIEFYSDHPEDILLAEAYNGVGDAYRVQHDCKSSLEMLTQAVEVARRIGNEIQMSHSLVNIGIVHWLEGDTRQALAKFRAAYRIQKRTDVIADRASTLHNIATIFLMDGRLKRGFFLMKHALELKREVGNLGEIARSLNNLGYAHQILGEPAKAVDYLAESLEINRKIGSKKELLFNIENLTTLKISAGQLREALVLAKEGIALATEQDYRIHVAGLQVCVATIAKRMGRPGEAARILLNAGTTVQNLNDNQVVLLHAAQSASLRLYIGDSQGALELATRLYDQATRDHNPAIQVEALLLLMKLSSDESYYDTAVKAIADLHLTRERRILEFGRLERLLNQGEEIANDARLAALMDELESVDDDLELSWMHNVGAEISLKRGNGSETRKHLELSMTAARKMGVVTELIVAQALMGQLAEAERDYETCYGLYKNALGLCKKISDDIESPADKLAYQSSRWVVFLAKAIKNLASKMGHKQKAGR